MRKREGWREKGQGTRRGEREGRMELERERRDREVGGLHFLWSSEQKAAGPPTHNEQIKTHVVRHENGGY